MTLQENVIIDGQVARHSCVAEFHEKMDLSMRVKFGDTDDQNLRRIAYAAQALLDLSKGLEPHVGDVHVCRAHLLIEELGEHLLSVSERDEVKAIDGLTDLQYVLDGTAEVFDWPMGAAFCLVHRSNMTKRRRGDDPGRVRDKGSEFIPPDIAGLLTEYRKGGGA